MGVTAPAEKRACRVTVIVAYVLWAAVVAAAKLFAPPPPVRIVETVALVLAAVGVLVAVLMVIESADSNPYDRNTLRAALGFVPFVVLCTLLLR